MLTIESAHETSKREEKGVGYDSGVQIEMERTEVYMPDMSECGRERDKERQNIQRKRISHI